MKDKNKMPTHQEMQLLVYEGHRKLFDLGVRMLQEAETLPSTPQTTKPITANCEKTIVSGDTLIQDALKTLRSELGLGKFKPPKVNEGIELSYLDLALLNMGDIEAKAIKKGIIASSQVSASN